MILVGANSGGNWLCFCSSHARPRIACTTVEVTDPACTDASSAVNHPTKSSRIPMVLCGVNWRYPEDASCTISEASEFTNKGGTKLSTTACTKETQFLNTRLPPWKRVNIIKFPNYAICIEHVGPGYHEDLFDAGSTSSSISWTIIIHNLPNYSRAC